MKFLEEGSTPGLTSAELKGIGDVDELLASNKVNYQDVLDIRKLNVVEGGRTSVVNSKGVAYPEVVDIRTGQNMVPLLKDVHRKVVTPWWNGYGQ